MQQQMFDQFQQTLVLMARMFTTMHQEQLALVREELRELHKVSEALRNLQEELKGQAPAAASPQEVMSAGELVAVTEAATEAESPLTEATANGTGTVGGGLPLAAPPADLQQPLDQTPAPGAAVGAPPPPAPAGTGRPPPGTRRRPGSPPCRRTR